MVKIRLRRMGAKKAPFYRIVVADSRYPRDGRFIEEIGTYDPNQEPSAVKVDAEKVKKWIANGAQPTDTVNALLKKNNVLSDKDPIAAAGPVLAPARPFAQGPPNRAERRNAMELDKLIVTIARGLVEDKDAVSVTRDEPLEDGTIVYHLHVAEDDMGRVIGKQGRIAKAIRTVVRAAANRAEEKVAVEID